MAVADVPGGPGWLLAGVSLRPQITDLQVFREQVANDPAGLALELLWSGKPTEAAATLAALPAGALSDVRRRALHADCLRDLGDTDAAQSQYRDLLQEVLGTAREAVIAQHYAKAATAGDNYPLAYALFDRAFQLRAGEGDDPTLTASSAQGLAWLADATGVTVRSWGQADAQAVAAVYAPYVQHTAVSFEDEPPSAQAMCDRLQGAHVAVVAEVEGQVCGYAYASSHRARAAYVHTVEVSVYVTTECGRGGVGTLLYSVLLDRLRRLGFHVALAGVTLPNEPSIRFHESLGFDRVGVYRQVGRKFDGWHDVAWYQRTLDSLP